MGECEGLARRVLQTEPANAEASGLLGKVLERRRQVEAALVHTRRAIEGETGRAEWRLDLGRMLERLEKWNEAAESYRHVAELEERNFAAHVGLGRVMIELGDFAGARGALARAMEIEPENDQGLGMMAEVMRQEGKAEEAEAFCRAAMERGADGAQVRMRLGLALTDLGREEEGLRTLRRAAEMAPEEAQAKRYLGDALRQLGRLEEAIGALAEAARLEPSAAIFVQLGNVLAEMGRESEAMQAFAEAISRQPQGGRLLTEIGTRGKRKAALEWLMAACRRQLEKDPEHAGAWFGLGIGHQGKRQLNAAEDAYRKALASDPDHGNAMNNLAMVLKDQGEMEESIALLKRAAEVEKPGNGAEEAMSNYLYALHFSPRVDRGDGGRWLLKEHREWDRRFGANLAAAAWPHRNRADLEKRLRVGYVSPNFSEHPVGRFLLGFFPALSHENFETICYSSVRAPDEYTERFKRLTDHFVECRRMPDAVLAGRIQADGVDILVDLTMHMAQNRMMVYARRPAPVQIAYLAYCSTTGVSAMDWRITDPYLDPPAIDETERYSERSLRLPESYWCYDPGKEGAAEGGPLPALEHGHVTFGSFNNFCKVSPQVRRAWGRIMNAVTGSRLILHAYEGRHRERFVREFGDMGIVAERIEFVDFLELPQYLELHRRVDVVLDTFPYPGGTTTCDSLWMGVPVVSLAGERGGGAGLAFMRSGLSILSNVGLPELAAETEEGYVETAVGLATDLPRLAALRAGLRERMRRSPLMDAKRFAAGLEGCFRAAWRDWCLPQKA